MFGKMIYYDKETVDEYKSIIKGQKHIEIDEYEISNDKGAKFDLKAISGDANSSKKYTAKVAQSMLFDCDEFEKMLSDSDEFFDFTQTDDYDLNTVNRGSIIKVDAFFEIPEKFDLMQLIDSFKPLLIKSFNEDQIEQSSKEVLKLFFGNAKASKIPLIVDVDDFLLSAKINKDSILVEYDELEEFSEEEVTILARVSSGMINSSKPFYEPLKDFMSLNRMMRKSITDCGEELEPLRMEKEYRRIDILAIYR